MPMPPIRKDGNNKKKADLQLVKASNLALVLDLIYQRGSISRAEAAKITKLSATTVSSLFQELLRHHLIVETGTVKTSTSGRRPVMVELNRAGKFIVALEIDEKGFVCSLFDLGCGRISESRHVLDDFDHLGEAMIAAMEAMLEQHKKNDNCILGIAIGAPALIHYEEHQIISSTVLPAMKADNDFYRRLTQRFANAPVFFENSSYFCAYAEKCFGFNAENLVFLEINKGVGSGIIVNGKMFRGAYGLAGEAGHISIDMNGPKCLCGNRGCLEMMTSVPAIIQKFVFAIISGRDTIMNAWIGGNLNKLDLSLIGSAISQNDELAMEIADDIAQKLAFGLNNIINLFNPQAIVFGGEIAKMGDTFLGLTQKHLGEIGLKPQIDQVTIKYSSLNGANIVAVGAAKFALDNIFGV